MLHVFFIGKIKNLESQKIKLHICRYTIWLYKLPEVTLLGIIFFRLIRTYIYIYITLYH